MCLVEALPVHRRCWQNTFSLHEVHGKGLSPYIKCGIDDEFNFSQVYRKLHSINIVLFPKREMF